jgi:hypothetical protein
MGWKDQNHNEPARLSQIIFRPTSGEKMPKTVAKRGVDEI